MRIVFVKPILTLAGQMEPGDVIDVSQEEAQFFLNFGYAEIPCAKNAGSADKKPTKRTPRRTAKK